MTNETRIERKLQAEWDVTTDAEELEKLRDAFERLGLDHDPPVLVSGLTQVQIDRLESIYPEDTAILAMGRTWMVINSAIDVEDFINQRDELVDAGVQSAM